MELFLRFIEHHIATDATATRPTHDLLSDDLMFNETQEKFHPSICLHFFVFLFVTALCGGPAYLYYYWGFPKSMFYNMTYVGIVYVLSVLLLLLNLCDAFHSFHESFARCCCHRGATVFTLLMITFGVVEYILWQLEEENLLDSLYPSDDSISQTYLLLVIDIVYYLALLMLFCASMANWPTLSYYLSEALWLQAMLYMSIFGYLLLWLCRKLRGSEA